ncbi:MAG: molybdopterin synthase sulfur carrier subunit [Candidatus Azotimanducaceae bacterium]
MSFTGSIRSAVDGIESLNLEADTIHGLLRSLTLRYPKLESLLESDIAVAINGEIYRDNWDTKIPAEAEVFLLPRIQGG